MSPKLALFGGPKTINRPFRQYNTIGCDEAEAVKRVVESGVLSKFLGCWDPDFNGGPEVQAFERQCETYFDVKHAITVNSWTSGLIAAVGAIGIEPGDEVIVSPWTMCASATAILHWNAIPVFVDIEPETFCLDPVMVERSITEYTKAIITVDIFGHPSNTDALMSIAAKHGLMVIADTAQAPGARYKGRYAGTVTHVGGYSLNYHKHIHSGEGGIVVTDIDEIADRVRLIRNHAEAVVGDMGFTDLRNMVGFNFRLGEIESAIGSTQLTKLERFVDTRQRAAERLTQGLTGMIGLRTPVIEPDCTHVYYVYPMILDTSTLGVDRARIVSALQAEGLHGLKRGYTCLHLLPMYQHKLAYGSRGFPWTSDICRRDVNYAKGICPVAEKLHDEAFLGFEMCLHELGDADVDLIIRAFRKVWANLAIL